MIATPEAIAISICLVILGFVAGMALVAVVNYMDENAVTYTYDIQEMERLIVKLTDENKKLRLAMYDIQMTSNWHSLPPPNERPLKRPRPSEDLSPYQEVWANEENEKDD